MTLPYTCLAADDGRAMDLPVYVQENSKGVSIKIAYNSRSPWQCC